jgi:hypothetical protein
VENLLARNRWFIRVKGWIAHHHLKQYDSKGPPINGLVVAALTENFGRDVVGGAHCGEGKLAADLGLGFESEAFV